MSPRRDKRSYRSTDRRRPAPSTSRSSQTATAGRSPDFTTPALAAAWQAALAAHRQGDMATAKRHYCEILQQVPEQADTWHMLGVLLFQAQEPQAALDCLQHAQKFSRADLGAEFHANLGLVLLATGQAAAARQALEKAVALRPAVADNWNNLGSLCLDERDYVRAEQAFRETLRLQPQHPHAWSNLGTALQGQRRYLEAKSCHERSLDGAGDLAAKLNNLGSVLQSLRDLKQAEATFRRALAIAPGQAETVINLGRTLNALGRSEEAVQLLSSYVDQYPQSKTARHYLGIALAERRNFAAAITQFERAIELDPDYAIAYGSLGQTRLQQGELSTAVQLLRRALTLRPDLHETHGNLLFVLSNDDAQDAATLFEEHVRWGQLHGSTQRVFDHSHRSRDAQRRLRIGYVSPDLHDHAVARFIEPTLACHNRDQVEVFCYAQVHVEDVVTQRLKQHADHWRSTCGQSYFQVAEMIEQDQIDILVDLAGHTAGNRLLSFAYQPAPIQISWLGYPNTTGLPAMQYRLTSEIQDPPHETSYHTEQLVRLSYGTNCYAAPTAAPDVAPSPCLSRGYITFGSLHRPQKISAAVFDLWARVLAAVPTARLKLFHTTFTPDLVAHVARQLEQRGIAAGRFEIVTHSDHDHYLAEYHAIDIGLDVFPWNGGTTTREAMWMGVPVVGLMGDRRSARGTAATLHYSGLSELIAHSPDDYVRLAQALAADTNRLVDLRQTLRDRLRSTICDAHRFTASLEDVYRQLWQRWCGETASQCVDAIPHQHVDNG